MQNRSAKINQQQKLFTQFIKNNLLLLQQQYPFMQSSQKIKAIKKAWENMNNNQRLSHKSYSVKIQHQYSQEQGKTPSKYEFFKKTDQKLRTTCAKTKNSNDIQLEQLQGQNIKGKLFLQQYQSQDQEKVTEKQQSTIKNQYHIFYQRKYNDLAKNHPRWTSKMINEIIKLLWIKQKRINSAIKRKNNRKIMNKRKEIMKVTGKRAFQMSKKISISQTNEIWNSFPYENKIDWSIKGDPHKRAQRRLRKVNNRYTEVYDNFSQKSKLNFLKTNMAI